MSKQSQINLRKQISPFEKSNTKTECEAII